MTEDELTRLHIAMNDIARMDELQGGDHAGHDECDISLFEEHLLAEVVAEVASTLELQGKVTVAPIQLIIERSNTKRDLETYSQRNAKARENPGMM